jgi:hypothetical protein
MLHAISTVGLHLERHAHLGELVRRTMRPYTLFLLDGEGAIALSETSNFETDEAAIGYARELRWPWAYEVWRQSSLVMVARPPTWAREAAEAA